MCGIVGKLTLGRIGGVRQPVVRAMAESLVHRGPDGCGFYFGPGIGLGHRALNCEPNASDRQPLANEDATAWVIADGHVINGRELRAELRGHGHVFRTTASAETIVHGYEQWGAEIVHRIRGAVAFAVWDARKRKLLLVRDPLGVKPLFYTVLEDGVVFASEMKALLEDPEVPRACDPAALKRYLALQHVPTPDTMLAGIRKIPAGHLVVSDCRGTKVHEYWDLPSAERAGTTDERDYVEAAAIATRDAVRATVSGDGQTVVLLSDGVVSAAVAGIARDTRSHGLVAVTAAVDDGPIGQITGARDIARELNVRHRTEFVALRIADRLPKLAWHLDEPFGDPAAVKGYLIAAAANRHAGTAVAGYGGSEVWGGLARHRAERREWILRRTLGPLRLAGAVLGALMPHEVPGARSLRLLAEEPSEALARKHGLPITRATAMRRLLTPEFLVETAAIDPYARVRAFYRACDSPDPLERALYVEAKTTLADNVLALVDRTSMAVSLDLRLPLVDRQLVELAARVPPFFKLSGRVPNRVLRQLAAARTPSAATAAPQDSFGNRVAAWLRGPLAPMLSDVLLSGRFRQRGVFQPKAVTRLWQEHLTGRRDHHQALWSLLMLELWFQQFVDGARQEQRAA